MQAPDLSLTLYFLRYVLFVNCGLFVMWLAAVIIPFLLSPPTTFAWSYFTTYPRLSLLQGYGLHNTFLLYGCAHACVHACTVKPSIKYMRLHLPA